MNTVIAAFYLIIIGSGPAKVPVVVPMVDQAQCHIQAQAARDQDGVENAFCVSSGFQSGI